MIYRLQKFKDVMGSEIDTDVHQAFWKNRFNDMVVEKFDDTLSFYLKQGLGKLGILVTDKGLVELCKTRITRKYQCDSLVATSPTKYSFYLDDDKLLCSYTETLEIKQTKDLSFEAIRRVSFE